MFVSIIIIDYQFNNVILQFLFKTVFQDRKFIWRAMFGELDKCI